MNVKNEKSLRLKNIIEDQKMSARHFGAKCGISSGMISRYLSGESEITAKAAYKVKGAFPKVNIEWLLFGTGSMYEKGGEAARVDPPAQDDTVLEGMTPEEMAGEIERLDAEVLALIAENRRLNRITAMQAKKYRDLVRRLADARSAAEYDELEKLIDELNDEVK